MKRRNALPHIVYVCETNIFVVCTETLSVGFGRLLTMLYDESLSTLENKDYVYNVLQIICTVE